METTKRKAGRPNKAQAGRNFEIYCKSRAKGHNQKDSGNLAGIAEKTAGRYEKLRQQAQAGKAEQLRKLRQRLEAKADRPEITAKDLISLTKYIKQLDDEICGIA